MASSRSLRRVEIPKHVWDALDECARRSGMPTSQLAGTWLWSELHRRSRIPGDVAEGLAIEDNPYCTAVRSYRRRGQAATSPA